MQPIQLNLNSFEGTVDKIIDDNGEDIIRTIHNDGTETFYGKHGSLINIWKTSNDINVDHLTIVQNKSKNNTIKTILDSKLKDKLKIYTWTVWNPNRSETSKSYVRVTNCKKFSFIHEYVLHLNGIQKPDDGKTYSVDHINRDTLDNRLENLRWATQSEQNQNTDKRERKHNARELPDGITQKDMPKYVTYNEEIYNKEKNLKRNYFRIEKHPSKTTWTSSKSNNISIQDKLAEAYKKLQELGDIFDHIPDFVQSSTRDPEFMSEEHGFVLKRSMMPQYVNFVKETDKRGCKFEIAIPGKKRVCTSGSKGVKLEDKFNAMLQLREQALND